MSMVYSFGRILRWPHIQWKSPACNESAVWFSVERVTDQETDQALLCNTGLSGSETLSVMAYLGTSESPPLNVVGSSSNMEEMSFPSGTDTRVYMTLSWTFLRRARKASCSESSWWEKPKQRTIRNCFLQSTHWFSTWVTEIICHVCVKISDSQVFQWKGRLLLWKDL